MNDRERGLWIINDEQLYIWWKSTGLSKRDFMRKRREELDAVIKAKIDRKPAVVPFEVS